MHAALAKLCAGSLFLSCLLVACSPGAPPTYGEWEPMAAHPEASAVRDFDAADYADGKLFVWGGAFSRGFLYDANTNAWRETSAVNRPQETVGASVVWAGGRVLFWGRTGAIYDPDADTWRPMSTVNAPAPRQQHAAVWTGTKLIIWGGANGPDPREGHRADGALYDPATDTWTAMSTRGAPSPRVRFSAVWTGRLSTTSAPATPANDPPTNPSPARMIVFGGQDESGRPLGDGASYDPDTNAWTPLPPSADTPDPRYFHTAVWTGVEMAVLAGLCAENYCTEGTSFNPSNGTWRKISSKNQSTPRYGAVGIWTGTHVVIWSGVDRDDGYRWEPLRDEWSRMAKEDSPAPRAQAFAFWLGDRMLVWGGANRDGNELRTSGGFYRP